MNVTRRALDARRDDDGFSMAELVVAMFVIAATLTVIIGVQLTALSTVTDARKLQQATAMANEAVEQMRSIPWNTLSRGMDDGFLAASGGDPLVSGNTLTVGGESLTLRINDQNPSVNNIAPPLFDANGSHTQVREDPSLTGVEFTVKGYVVESAAPSTLGIVVVVEWDDRRGDVQRTVVRSQAFRGSDTGCGDLDTQPFLGSCQAFFEADARTGTVSTAISALNDPASPSDQEPVQLLFPNDNDNTYTFHVRSATASASVSSQQVSIVGARVAFGGTTQENASQSIIVEDGSALYELVATDDFTTQSGLEANPADVAVTQTAWDESQRVVDHSSSDIEYLAVSDYARPISLDASVTNSCLAGIPAASPCARAAIANEPDIFTGSGYLVADVDTDRVRLSRRLVENTSSASEGNVEQAWAARFATASSSISGACTTVSGSGCVAAGATRTLADVNIGTIIGSSWNGGTASAGLVNVQGSPSCPAGQGRDFYADGIQVEAGANQTSSEPIAYRCGQVEYWNGSSYSYLQIDESTSATITTGSATWTSSDGEYTLTASGTIEVLPESVAAPVPADPDCKTEACVAIGSAGTIVVVVEYRIQTAGSSHIIISTTTIDSPSARASFKETPSA